MGHTGMCGVAVPSLGVAIAAVFFLLPPFGALKFVRLNNTQLVGATHIYVWTVQLLVS